MSGDFERAFRSFQQLYHVRPKRVLCSPDVLSRFCQVYERPDEAHRRNLRYQGIPVSAGIMAPGMVAFEGEVDPGRMGDW